MFSTLIRTAVMGLALATFATTANSEVIKIDYEGFTVWVNCDINAAVKFRYNAQHDVGFLKRANSFKLDKSVPASCQQTSSSTYKSPGKRYDRGHMVPANHLDHSKKAIVQSNFMTNITPQAANMNRGAWLLTEEVTECYRDIDELLIIGGAVYNDPTNDFFLASHGIPTAEFFWKVIIRPDRVIAWYVPNTQDATRANLDSYIVSVRDIERLTGETIPVDDYLKDERPSRSWMIPIGCNKG